MDGRWAVILCHILFTFNKVSNRVKVKISYTFSCIRFNIQLKVEESMVQKRILDAAGTFDVQPDLPLHV